jgi:dUTP pyrophosphatase
MTLATAQKFVANAGGLDVPVLQMPHAAGLPLPVYATEHSAGCDVVAAVDAPVTIQPQGIAIIPTGICVAVPPGFELQVRARSGLAAKNGIGLVNGVGTIDADYRGEIKVIMINHGAEPFVVERGMRIAQFVIAQYTSVSWQQVTELSETARGTGGLGSTGK